MSDETTKTDAEVIARAQQRYADLRAITTLRMASPEETALLVRVASTGADLIAAQIRTIDALTAERDAARAELARLRERLTKIADENGWISEDEADDE